MIARLLIPLAIALAACTPVPQGDTATRAVISESTLPPMKTFAARAPDTLPVSNRDLARDFMSLSFQMESGRELVYFTRFEGPITLRVTGKPAATFMPDLRNLLARLSAEAGINIQITSAADANITINSVKRTAIQRVLPQAACFVAPNVTTLQEFRSARRSPKTNWATLQTRTRIGIFIPNDSSPQEVRDCLHEEIAQSLGPLNDLYRLPNSVFNDDNVHTVLTSFDMLILKATYAPELNSGMTQAEVAARLPAIYARINPRGRALPETPASPTPISYARAIQRALGPGASPTARRAAADQAIRIATRSGWTDNRRAFAHYAKGRLLQPVDSEAANRQYLIADSFYARSRQTRLHRAYVATQLSAYQLSSGNIEQARVIAARNISAARAGQNAALLSTLQLLTAQALEAQGRVSEARKLRLDSLGWARYGFGSDWAVRSKMREISTLTPAKPPA